jgi:hypothetical protein
MSAALPFARERDPRTREQDPVLGLVVDLVGQRARRRLVWLDQLRGERGSLAIDDPESEQRFFEQHEPLAPINQRITELEQRLGDSETDSLHRFAAMFVLDDAEFDLLLTCVAPEIEPAIAELYARLQGYPERRYATEQLAARLFGWGRRSLFRPDGGLARWGLIQPIHAAPGQPRPLILDRQLLARIHGDYHLDAELVGCATLLSVNPALDSWPLATACARIERSFEHDTPLRFIVTGPDGCGRRSFAAAIARRVGAQALAIDCDAIADEHWPELYVCAVRLARMAGLVLVWHGERIDRRWPQVIRPAVLQFVVCEDPSKVRGLTDVVDQRIVMPNPSLDERRTLWRRMVQSSVAWPEHARERLVSRHRLSVGDIAEIGRRLPNDANDAATHAREQTRGRLGELGQLLDCPFDWDDLVVADRLRESLEDFTFEASERAAFWERPEAQRLFPRGTGLVGLLTGPPGTGKTMAAQVVAAELELDLFRINLATVISKYIGETAKNLDKIFSRAARMNAVLLFDEADALFSKRTEVKDSHDRYANTDTNYLLQLLEDYQGIALLASNKKNNIDAAFVRRIRYVLDFARPDVKQRWTIWRKILGEMLGTDALRQLEPAIAVLAETVDISGAQIKNSVLAAMFVARRRREPTSIEHLICGIDRELGKEGRAINDRERERLRRNG